MASNPGESRWAQVLGAYDLEAGQAQITSVQPATSGARSLSGGEERVRVKGFNQTGDELFDLAVNPMQNSRAPRPNAGTFEEFILVTDDLKVIRLYIDGEEAADFVPGSPAPVAGTHLGSAPEDRPHVIPLTGAATSSATNVSYTIQARPNDDTLWQTIGIGLPTIEAGEIDINQFPGAKTIHVRILQNDGFSETEVYRDTITF